MCIEAPDRLDRPINGLLGLFDIGSEQPVQEDEGGVILIEVARIDGVMDAVVHRRIEEHLEAGI